jgi:hypothetical protein
MMKRKEMMIMWREKDMDIRLTQIRKDRRGIITVSITEYFIFHLFLHNY